MAKCLHLISTLKKVSIWQKFLQPNSIGDDAIYFMVIGSKGEKWVLNWFTFSAKTKGGKEVIIPVSMNLQFEGDKIVFPSSMYDQLPLMLAIQAEQNGV